MLINFYNAALAPLFGITQRRRQWVLARQSFLGPSLIALAIFAMDCLKPALIKRTKMSNAQKYFLFALGLSSMVFFALVAIEHDLTPIVIGICVIGGAVIVQFVQGMYPMAVWIGMVAFVFSVTFVGSQAWFAGAVVVTISIITLIVTRRSA